MKKLGQRGFTLIELLAVITIMGILMMIAIPAVSRTIENSRRDTFADIAHEYINAVRNNVLADNISCKVGSDTMVASATPTGTYYFAIDTATDGTKDLMESGGKSPFGNAEMKGYVKWVKLADDTTGKTTTKYSMVLTDSGKHGFDTETAEADIKRSAVKTKLTSAQVTAPTTAGTGTTLYGPCTLS